MASATEADGIGVAPAILNAVAAATGARIVDLPARPARVLEALRAAAGYSARL